LLSVSCGLFSLSAPLYLCTTEDEKREWLVIFTACSMKCRRFVFIFIYESHTFNKTKKKGDLMSRQFISGFFPEKIKTTEKISPLQL